MMKSKFRIEGMTCEACKRHVYEAVIHVNGVNNCNVNLLTNTMIVEYDNNYCSENEIENAVLKKGYKAYLYTEKKNSDNSKDNSLLILIISTVLLLFLMYFSMGHMMWGFPTFKCFDMEENPMGFALVQFIIVLPILYLNRNYFISGFTKLFKGTPNMDSLIAIGATASTLYGIYSLFMISLGYNEYHMYLYFESAGMILVFVSLGKFLEKLSKRKTTEAVSKMMDLAPKKAIIEKDDKEIEVNAIDVLINDIVIVKKGDKIPVDGYVVFGNGSVDQSNITGESIPVYKKKDDEVYSSTILTSGYLKIKATKAYEDSTIANIIRLVDEASNSKAPISKLVDKISKIFIPLILGIALITFIANYIYIRITSFMDMNAFETALNFAITVVVIACPCALGLATPVAIMVGTGKGASNKILIKDATILEKAHLIKTVVFDKTGTITEGKPKVTDFIKFDDIDLESIVYSIENKSEHPLANSLVTYTENKKKNVFDIKDFKQIEGLGLEGKINEDMYFIGNIKYFDDKIDNDLINKLYSEGKIVLVVSKNNNIIGIIGIKDEIKDNSKEAIKLLKNESIKVVMLTGDNKITASKIGKEVGVDEVISEVLPEDKANIIRSLKTDDKHLVAMVGDGVNDALALTVSDLGIGLGCGSDVAIESSDIVLLRNDLLDVYNAISLSNRVLRTIKIGLFWAFFYNFICVFLATGILFYLTKGSFKMEPMYGAIAMSISSVSVILNALTINLFKVKRNKEKIFKNECEDNKMENKMIINVDGMMCKHCTSHVENECMKIDGVVSAYASLEEKNVTIILSKDVSRDIFVQAIKSIGYEAK